MHRIKDGSSLRWLTKYVSLLAIHQKIFFPTNDLMWIKERRHDSRDKSRQQYLKSSPINPEKTKITLH